MARSGRTFRVRVRGRRVRRGDGGLLEVAGGVRRQVAGAVEELLFENGRVHKLAALEGAGAVLEVPAEGVDAGQLAQDDLVRVDAGGAARAGPARELAAHDALLALVGGGGRELLLVRLLLGREQRRGRRVGRRGPARQRRPRALLVAAHARLHLAFTVLLHVFKIARRTKVYSILICFYFEMMTCNGE